MQCYNVLYVMGQARMHAALLESIEPVAAVCFTRLVVADS